MKKNLVALTVITISVFAIYHFALFNFFTQDDFILINQFSQNNLLVDLRNIFLSKVTHWRPVHNLYFLIAGNLFDKNIFGYHLMNFIIHISTSFLIYKAAAKIISAKTALIAGLFYALHPAHFVSLVWISGAATTIGFFFMAASFYSYLLKKNKLAFALYSLSLLSSEAMLAGLGIFILWGFLKDKSESWRNFFVKMFVTSTVFVFVKLLFLTTKTAFASYEFGLGWTSLAATKYYLLRVLGFGETTGDQVPTLILVLWTLLIIALVIIKANRLSELKTFIFLLGSLAVGLFPFILIPKHLSPHYTNISVWALGLLITWAFLVLRPQVAISLFLIFATTAILNVQLTRNNNWVTTRSNLAKFYLEKIETANFPPQSTIVFADNPISSSYEAYISLGTGEGVKFWFPEKNYRVCFEKFEKCEGYRLNEK